MMVLASKDLGKSHMNGIGAFIRRDTRACHLSLLSVIWEYKAKMVIYKPESRPSQDTGSANTLILKNVDIN